MKEERIEFVAGDESAEGLQPADGSFNDPAAAEAPQRPAILSGWPHAAAAMRADQLDPAGCQLLAQRIAVGGADRANPGRDALSAHVVSWPLMDDCLTECPATLGDPVGDDFASAFASC